jgi:hypothetical protein
MDMTLEEAQEEIKRLNLRISDLEAALDYARGALIPYLN